MATPLRASSSDSPWSIASPPTAQGALTLTVYFEGTANTIRPVTTQIGSLFSATDAQDLSEPDASPAAALQAGHAVHFKMGFDGCGVTAGLMGVLFAYGLAPQVERVAERAAELCAGWPAGPLRLNVVGLSRGGIAACMLARRLCSLPCAERLHLCVCLFDPVPGNLVTTARYIDITGAATTANRHADLSGCACLVRCLALYPCEPLPDLAFHAPLLPAYPEGCQVEEDATLGCHQAALYPLPALRKAAYERTAVYTACLLSHVRVRRFLLECGTRLREHDSRDPLEAQALQAMEQELARPQRSYRAAICRHGPASIVRGDAETAPLLNRHHYELLRATTPSDPRVKGVQPADIDAHLLLSVVRPAQRGATCLPPPEDCLHRS